MNDEVARLILDEAKKIAEAIDTHLDGVPRSGPPHGPRHPMRLVIARNRAIRIARLLGAEDTNDPQQATPDPRRRTRRGARSLLGGGGDASH